MGASAAGFWLWTSGRGARGPKRLWHAVDGAAHQRRAALLAGTTAPQGKIPPETVKKLLHYFTSLARDGLSASVLVAPSMPFHAKAALVSLLHPFRRVAAFLCAKERATQQRMMGTEAQTEPQQ